MGTVGDWALLTLTQSSMAADETPSNALTMAVDGYFDAWVNGRIPTMVSYLTPDSEYHPNGSATVTGRDALRAFYQDFMDNYDIELAWQYEQTEIRGDTGFVMGVYFIRYAPMGSREEIARGGRFFMDMRLGADGQWRIRRELTQTTADALPELTP
jgi:ketosteroid isomerase-like protein